jgi:hypothetical protein
MTDEFILGVIDTVLFSVEDRTVLKRVLAGDSWTKALGGDCGAMRAWGSWYANAAGIRIEDPEGNVVRLVQPGEIAARAKQIAASAPAA